MSRTDKPGMVEAWLRKLMQDEVHSQPREATQPSNAESTVIETVDANATAADSGGRGPLEAGGRRLVTAVQEAAAVEQEVAAVQTDPGRQARDAEHAKRGGESLNRPIDLDRPTVPLGFLMVCEIVLCLAELNFWFETFSTDIDRSVPALGQQRISAFLLALALPLLGVMAARWAGATAQRALLHPAPDENQRRHQRIGASLALSLLLGVCTAVFVLVRWRFTAGVSLGGIEIPATPMALMFAGFIIADALARAFLVSEKQRQSADRDQAWHADRDRERTAAARRTSADAAWVQAWLDLRGQVDAVLNEANLMANAGAVLITSHRAIDPQGPQSVMAAAVTARPVGSSGLTVADASMPQLLQLPAGSTVLRHVASAVNLLNVYAPPSLLPQAQVTHLTRLYARGGHTAAAPMVGAGASVPVAVHPWSPRRAGL
ncbi:hypothetical protein ACFQY4_26020 [Catellatospora bangladeshensis]|uniref:Uncharacterized protein n=1 Tax=Catellatospora bangladeshensis TaxID=310355 RepID=A0A8J3NHR1_9ACTN|nr:hypothetical protein [Catellatospora bangladeshensis]GIF81655.1 hypothetical protein Cba03nite_30040 [Catellatospora bangladeshensis]